MLRIKGIISLADEDHFDVQAVHMPLEGDHER